MLTNPHSSQQKLYYMGNSADSFQHFIFLFPHIEEGSGDEYISDEEGITMSSSDMSSESEEEPPPPKHEIPVIVIDTSPGNQDTELDWGPKEVRAALGQPLEPEDDDAVVLPPTSVAEATSTSFPNAGSAVFASPKSSDNRTSSSGQTSSGEQLLPHQSTGTLGTSVSSGLSSSSNVEDLSEFPIVRAAGEAVAVVMEDRGSPSLTDVSSDVGSKGPSDSATSPPSHPSEVCSTTGAHSYNLLLDEAGSSGSSSVPTPADECVPSSTASDSSAVCFGRLTANSSSASSSLRSASATGYNVQYLEDSDSEEQELLMSDKSPVEEHGLTFAALAHPPVSRTVSAGSQLSDGIMSSASAGLCVSDRPDSSETSTETAEGGPTVVQCLPPNEEPGGDELSSVCLILERAMSHGSFGLQTATAELPGGLTFTSMEAAHFEMAKSASSEVPAVLERLEAAGQQVSPIVSKECFQSSGNAVPAVLSLASSGNWVDFHEAPDQGGPEKFGLVLPLNTDVVIENAASPNILSPQSDITDEDTTCSASISDQEVFPMDDDLQRMDEPVATSSPDLLRATRSGLFAPIASMSDEDDLTASDTGARGRRREVARPPLDEVLLEAPEEFRQPSTLGPLETCGLRAPSQSDEEDDFTTSEWAREGGKREELSVLEDLKAEFQFDDRNVTRRRKKKRWTPPPAEPGECLLPPADDFKKGEPRSQVDDVAGLNNSNKDVDSTLQEKDGGVVEERDNHRPVREAPKFQGYGGSFAEKVRGGRTSDGDPRDSIYLKSLNINLQRLEFPSISSSSPSSRGSCEELDSDSCLVRNSPAPASSTVVTRQTKSAQSLRTPVRPQQLPEPLVQNSKTPSSQPRPCPDPVTAMLMSRRELLCKSVHEDIQNLPYFDSQSLAGDFEEFKTPEGGNTPTETFETPPTSRPGHLFSFASTDPERERARREARERARLKSDEELGLSPCSYRRKYARTPAFDEITLTDLLDQEDETFNALDDRSSLRSFSTFQNRLAQFEDDDDAEDDEPTPIASPARSTEELDRPDEAERRFREHCTSTIISSDPYQIRADVWKPKPKPKRRLFATRGEDEDKKGQTTSSSLTKRNLLSFLGFSRNSGGDSSSGVSKEKKESYNREKAARDATADSERTGTFSRLRLSKSRADKSAQKKSTEPSRPLLRGALQTQSAEKGDVPSAKGDEVVKRSVVASSTARHRRPPVEEMKKHISLDNLKSQPIQLPAKSKSVEFDVMEPRAADDDVLLNFDDGNIDADIENGALLDKKGKAVDQRKLERLTLRVQRQQELKRLRTAQEIQRRLEEIEVSVKALERRGVLIERALRGEEEEDEDLRTDEKDLTQVLFRLMRQKNKLSREEQELLIRVKDLELENYHSKLQQEMRERMAVDDKEKSPRDIEKERQILNEMLEIVEKRDSLVAQMDQLRIR